MVGRHRRLTSFPSSLPLSLPVALRISPFSSPPPSPVPPKPRLPHTRTHTHTSNTHAPPTLHHESQIRTGKASERQRQAHRAEGGQSGRLEPPQALARRRSPPAPGALTWLPRAPSSSHTYSAACSNVCVCLLLLCFLFLCTFFCWCASVCVSFLCAGLLMDMIRAAKGDDPAVVLVVDPHTARILSSALRMYDLMESGVLVLQNLMLAREKLPDLPAIYFIEPTVECIEQLIKDFPAGAVVGAGGGKKALHSQYLHAHLYFTTHVPSAGMNLIKQSPGLLKRVKSFVELNVDFLAFESRVFLLDQPNSIPRLYFPTDHTRLSQTLSAISKPLVSFCITCQEYPHVRYSSMGKSGICKGLATFFDIDMKKTVSQLENWKLNENRERGTLLIVDRSMDPVAPLMHEYTFQAMVNDLLKVKGEIATLPVSTKGPDGLPKTASELAADKAASELVLSEDDDLWLEFRHQHIGNVLLDVTAKFKEFKVANRMAQLQSDDKSSVKDMIQAMKDMPLYKDMMKKYSKHMTLAKECMDKFDAARLQELGELEQDMATGLTSDGDSIKLKEVKDKLVSLCQDSRVSVLDKLRLLMIFIISHGGIAAATRRELMKTVDVELQDAIRNLESLGVDLSQAKEKKNKVSKERMAELKARNKDIPMALMRYLPQMHGVIEQLVQGTLKEELFPYTSPPPPGSATTAAAPTGTSARKGVSARKRPNGADWKSNDSSSSSSTTATSSTEDHRPRFIVFVLGGVTFSEMRSAYEIANKHNVNLYIGSTSTLTPTEYIRELSNLDPKAFKQAVQHSQAAARAGMGGASSGPAGGMRHASTFDDSDDEDVPVSMHAINIRSR